MGINLLPDGGSLARLMNVVFFGILGVFFLCRFLISVECTN